MVLRVLNELPQAQTTVISKYLGWIFSFMPNPLRGGPGFPEAAGRGVRYMKKWIAERAAERLGRTVEDVHAELSLFGMECKGLEFSMYITKESLA